MSFVIVYFTRVTLGMTDKTASDKCFALKCFQWHRVAQYGQQHHIMDEKNILASMEPPVNSWSSTNFQKQKFVNLLKDVYLAITRSRATRECQQWLKVQIPRI